MAAATPGAEYVEIPNAGHVPNINRPEAFNAALAAFLEI
jgi:3-oxoadipate enol-lactonase